MLLLLTAVACLLVWLVFTFVVPAGLGVVHALLGIGIALPSGAEPVLTETKPPACTMRSNAVRSTVRSLIIGNGFARHGSTIRFES